MRRKAVLAIAAMIGISETAHAGGAPVAAVTNAAFAIEAKANFVEPTAMAFLPDAGAQMNDCMLVTERAGVLKEWCGDGSLVVVRGTPDVAIGGEGGLIDVAPHPDFSTNRLVYMAWVEVGPNNMRGSVVGRAKMVNEEPVHDGVHLEGLTVLWRQELHPADIEHFGTRIAFGPEGELFITSGDRFFTLPAQDLEHNTGKIMRFTPEGRPSGKFYPEGALKASIWTLGHRNPAGLAFDGKGRMWEVEGRSRDEDALFLIRPGYDYRPPREIAGCREVRRSAIPCPPKWPLYDWARIIWTPPIRPTSMIIYNGAKFPAWRGSALITGLTHTSLTRVKLTGPVAARSESFKLDTPFRAIAEGPDGAVWLLEDKGNGRLFKLTPR
jgi:aldose sugar dehydrogenase